MDDLELLRRPVRLRAGVVTRDFPTETVVLHLQTGRFHTLNPTAATMLSAALGAPTASAAVDGLAVELGASEGRIREDLAQLLRGLLDREIVEGPAS